MRAVRTIAALALAVLGLAAPAAAADGNPDRYELGWHETMRVRGKVVMTFTVSRVHFQSDTWSAQVEFRNRWTKPLTIRRQFALVLGRTRSGDESFQALVARRSLPALPRVVEPGRAWKGILSGSGRPRTGTYVRVSFGYFLAPGLFGDSDGFSWVTDHVFRIELKA